MELRTERLKLLPIGPEYIDDIFANFTLEIVKYMYPKPAEQRSDTEAFVLGSMERYLKGTDIVFAVTKNDTGEFLGCMGIHHLDTLTPVLGLWLKKSAHGHAYGLEGMNAVIRYAFKNLKCHHLIYDVDKDNYPSRRIPELNGGVIQREYVKYGATGNKLNLLEFWLFKNKKNAKKKPPVILFQGDSITDCGRNREFAYGLGEGYPKKVQEQLPGCIVMNKGISGNRTCDLLERWQKETLDLKPDLLSIMIGVNEVWHHYKFGNVLTPEQYEVNYKNLLVQVKAKLPKTKILMIEPFVFPIGEWEPIWQADLDAEKKIVKRLAQEYADYYIPMDDILHKEAQTLGYAAILFDGVHPTDLGHQIIAKAIFEAIGPAYQ